MRLSRLPFGDIIVFFIFDMSTSSPDSYSCQMVMQLRPHRYLHLRHLCSVNILSTLLGSFSISYYIVRLGLSGRATMLGNFSARCPTNVDNSRARAHRAFNRFA